MKILSTGSGQEVAVTFLSLTAERVMQTFDSVFDLMALMQKLTDVPL